MWTSPTHNRHDDRTEAWARFHRDVVYGILIREFGTARRSAPSSSAAGGTGRIEKSQIVFFEGSAHANQGVQRTPITAIARASERRLLFKRSPFYQLQQRSFARGKHQELIWNRSAVHLFRSDHFINVDCSNLELYRMR
jgi:hypothetical protein